MKMTTQEDIWDHTCSCLTVFIKFIQFISLDEFCKRYCIRQLTWRIIYVRAGTMMRAEAALEQTMVVLKQRNAMYSFYTK